MTSFREERLQEQVAEIRPQLAKACEIAEKAESENRAMTAEGQKTYDEMMAKGVSKTQVDEFMDRWLPHSTDMTAKQL